MNAATHFPATPAPAAPLDVPECMVCADAGRIGDAYCDCDMGDDARDCDRGELALEWIGRNQDRGGDYSQYNLEWWLDRFTDAEMIRATAPASERSTWGMVGEGSAPHALPSGGVL